MASFSTFGNDLYTGRRSINFVGRRRLWYIIAAVLIVASVVGPFIRGGFEFGIEFRGGSQFIVERTSELDQVLGEEAVRATVADATPRVTVVGQDSVRVQTDIVTDDEAFEIRTALASSYDVPVDQVSYSFIGPTWGADITAQSIRALVVFLLLAGVVMALYFRTWKMSLAAMVALFHDLILTAGIYGILGFEVTPAAVIGFLTILGYSLYDTVVVFDKIRENTAGDGEASPRTFAESVNLAVNQTLVRSINTSVVAVLPVAAILFIGSFALGAETLRDISLALFIGIIVGAYSTIFIASPVYNHLRENEPEIKKQTARILAARRTEPAPVG
ncbi:protein translocase subunit SecF [Salinibacterium sp. dk2585]|uniref:protein translocase subunit SecF n=1 Tax=unclassified Salinibacterium TaxID=2632331 RepID=UPI0011C245F4|nr:MULTISPECIES: protein translocase subunit SecF [unclassified Salinibacterium]QEE61293.1 protein translocase subunit SecF [Salinibacterium sp. dk2585]TXK53969.1 protein translocase subunit SecF [Salinibacterium sp. dk5596]